MKQFHNCRKFFALLLLLLPSIAQAAPTTTVDGTPLATPTPRSSATATPTPSSSSQGRSFTYSEPFTVTIEGLTVRSIAQLFSSTSAQINRAQRSRCPRNSRVYAQSIELNGGTIGTPAANGTLPRLSGNARLTLVCQTRVPRVRATPTPTPTP